MDYLLPTNNFDSYGSSVNGVSNSIKLLIPQAAKSRTVADKLTKGRVKNG